MELAVQAMVPPAEAVAEDARPVTRVPTARLVRLRLHRHRQRRMPPATPSPWKHCRLTNRYGIRNGHSRLRMINTLRRRALLRLLRLKHRATHSLRVARCFFHSGTARIPKTEVFSDVSRVNWAVKRPKSPISAETLRRICVKSLISINCWVSEFRAGRAPPA